MDMIALTLATPFLVKVSTNNLLNPEFLRTEKCEVYPTEVVITKNYQGKVLKITQKIETKNLTDLVELAKNEETEIYGSANCNEPLTTVTGYMPNSQEEVVIYASTSCSSGAKLRQGPYSYSLMDIVNSFCPKTF